MTNQNNNHIDISFILPSNRDHNSFSKKVVDNINSLNFGEKTYEIVVVSPTEISGENVVFHKENGNKMGCVNAYNEGYNISKGNYIILCSDDHFFDKDVPSIVEIIESEMFKDKKYKIICLPTNFHGSCQLPEYCNNDGIIARYPVFKRDTVEEYLDGFIYHPKFKHHYPDNWLGYWMSEQGEPTIEYNNFNMITFNNSCDKIHDEYDENVFKELINNYKQGYKKYV
jgi:hypothetical protein